MALNVSRLGWVQLGVESTPGVPVTTGLSNVYETKESLEGMVKTLQQDAAYSQRDKVFSGQQGERWGQGDIEFNLDPIITPYLLGAALGTISDTTLSGTVVQHALSQSQSNPPTTLSIYRYRVADQQVFSYAAVEKLELGFAVDKFATGKASIKSFFPVDSVSGTVTRTARSLFTWGGATVQFGTSISNALAATATPVTDFAYNINNNTEAIFESGTLNSTRIAQKDFQVDGNYTLYFENTTDRNNYYNTTTESAVISMFGAKLGLGQYTEEVQLQLPALFLDTFSVETGLDNFFIEKSKYIGAYDVGTAMTTKAVCINNSTTP